MQNNSLNELIYSFEKRLLQPDIRKEAHELDVLLADEFVEYGSSGRIFNKQQVMDALANEDSVHMTIMDFQVTSLAADVVLATYRVLKHEDMKYSLRSSIWKFDDNRWQMVFHQGTPAAAL